MGVEVATDDDATVRSLLAAMRIEPPDDEVDEMIKSYPTLRAAADSLYAPEASSFAPAFSTTDAATTRSQSEAT